MEVIRLTFQCGHTVSWADGQRQRCHVCGETRLRRVAAPAPVFRGVARGPLAVGGTTDPVRRVIATAPLFADAKRVTDGSDSIH